MEQVTRKSDFIGCEQELQIGHANKNGADPHDHMGCLFSTTQIIAGL